LTALKENSISLDIPGSVRRIDVSIVCHDLCVCRVSRHSVLEHSESLTQIKDNWRTPQKYSENCHRKNNSENWP